MHLFGGALHHHSAASQPCVQSIPQAGTENSSAYSKGQINSQWKGSVGDPWHNGEQQAALNVSPQLTLSHLLLCMNTGPVLSDISFLRESKITDFNVKIVDF